MVKNYSLPLKLLKRENNEKIVDNVGCFSGLPSGPHSASSGNYFNDILNNTVLTQERDNNSGILASFGNVLFKEVSAELGMFTRNDADTIARNFSARGFSD
ncbi:MAG: hypothetical protein FWE37_04985 [Spirochaetaceae bacterium]|nr:hypothetical protein [Spirochaetaceae bacterium]